MKKDTSETITKIRSNTDAAENQRRIQEEKMKRERYVYYHKITICDSFYEGYLLYKYSLIYYLNVEIAVIYFQFHLYRAAAIQNEVITSHKKNVEIDWNWSELLDKEDCEELDEVRSTIIYL